MKLYTTPGGQWSGTEKDWIAKMKAEGLNPKAYDGRKQIEVPTSKPELLEFLTFHNVNVINPGAHPVVEVAGGDTPPPSSPSAIPDLDALRALHNPEAAPERVIGQVATLAAPYGTTVPEAPRVIEAQLDDLFLGAPIRKQVELAVGLLDRLEARTR